MVRARAGCPGMFGDGRVEWMWGEVMWYPACFGMDGGNGCENKRNAECYDMFGNEKGILGVRNMLMGKFCATAVEGWM